MAREKRIDMVSLGLLSHEERSGYDIKKQIDGAISFFWKGSFGNIYPALKDLESGGLIERNASNSGPREKHTYRITEAGAEALKQWLRNEQSVNELRYETLLKLFFSGCDDRKTALKNIAAFRKKVEADLAILKGYAANLEKVREESADHTYYYLTALFGIKSYEAYLEWCETAEKTIKS